MDIQFWYRRVYALCQSILLSPADAEDATQETFLRAWTNMGQLSSENATSVWLRQIARNACIDILRRNKVRQSQPLEPATLVGSSLSECPVENDTRQFILLRIHSLPESLREIILLHYYEEMTYDQMADWLDIARSTVNERLSKARKILREQLSEDPR